MNHGRHGAMLKTYFEKIYGISVHAEELGCSKMSITA